MIKYDTIVTRRKTKSVRNVALEGVETLRAEKVHTTYEVVKEVNPKTGTSTIISKTPIEETVEPLVCKLHEVDAKTIIRMREEKVPTFVLKIEDKLYCTEIPRSMNVFSSDLLGPHMCGLECKRLSAALDEEGGCAKVRNRARYIERYSWITRGYETFSTKHDVFVVAECGHYKKCPPRKRPSVAEINAAKLSLAQFVWDDVDTIEEVRKRKDRVKRLDIM